MGRGDLIKKVGVHLGALLFLGLIYYQNGFAQFLIFLISLAVHELAHVFSARLFGVNMQSFYILPLGARIVYENKELAAWKEVVMYLSGPASNFMLALAIGIASCYTYVPNYDFFIFYSVLIGLINMIPALPLDLSRCLLALMALKCSRLQAMDYMVAMTRLVSAILILLGAYVFLVGRQNILLLILGVFFLKSARDEQEKAVYQALRGNLPGQT